MDSRGIAFCRPLSNGEYFVAMLCRSCQKKS